jgi:signal transduction histidine kinase
MAVGLTAASAGIWWITSNDLRGHLDHSMAAALLLGIVLVGTGATFTGAWRLAGSAVQPVREITKQATRIAAGTLDQRISAHADTEEYRGLVAVLNSMLQRLDGAFRAQRRFTWDVSHELRTPLTALRGEIEVALRAERTPREYQRVFHSALEEIERLTTMTEELLLISRAEAGMITLQREPTDVNVLVDASLKRYGGEIAAKQLVVEQPPASDGGQPLLDRELMQQLIDELVENAVKYSEPSGPIRIAIARRTEGLRLTVENSAPGVAMLELPHIFEPFYRADTARSRGTGTGLGLAVAAAVARLHGGEIRAGSRDGAVVWVEVDLPAPGGS